MVVARPDGAGSMSAAAAAAADERAHARPYTSRFPGLQAARDAQAAGLAGSGAVAGSANDGNKNATASGACDDDEEESEISGLQKLSVHLPHYPQHNLLHHLTLLHRHKRLQSAARLYLRARLGLVGQ